MAAFAAGPETVDGRDADGGERARITAPALKRGLAVAEAGGAGAGGIGRVKRLARGRTLERGAAKSSLDREGHAGDRGFGLLSGFIEGGQYRFAVGASHETKVDPCLRRIGDGVFGLTSNDLSDVERNLVAVVGEPLCLIDEAGEPPNGISPFGVR